MVRAPRWDPPAVGRYTSGPRERRTRDRPSQLHRQRDYPVSLIREPQWVESRQRAEDLQSQPGWHRAHNRPFPELGPRCSPGTQFSNHTGGKRRGHLQHHRVWPGGNESESVLRLGWVTEIFRFDRSDLLQLTAFGRADTYGGILSDDGQHVFFNMSADPFGTNPTENCQIFSIDTLGNDLRRSSTQFRSDDHSENGCFLFLGLGCGIGNMAQDPETHALVFASSCNPLGTNPNGYQMFAMRPDGTGLIQLTNGIGVVEETDGTVDAQLPGPSDYSARSAAD